MTRGISTREDQLSKIIQAKRVGACNADACTFAGVPQSTFYQWVKIGKKAKQGKHFDFVQRLQAAEASAVVASLVTIQQVSKSGTWQAAAWFLERTRPYQYGMHAARFAREERERLEATGVEAQAEAATQASVEATLLDLATRLSPEASRELLDALRATKGDS